MIIETPELNKDLKGKIKLNTLSALILKHFKTCYYIVRLLYLVGPTILICNPDILENIILFVLLR